MRDGPPRKLPPLRNGVPGRKPSGPAGRPAWVRPEDDPPGTSRLFVAIPVADEVRRAVGQLMEAVAGAPIDARAYGQPRWVRVDGLHLTLKFLGPTPDVRQQELATALQVAAEGVSPFTVSLNGGGTFPHPAAPRVLWMGITEGVPELGSLAARLSAELQRLGWAPDDRPFQPHLTLARTDGVPGAAERGRKLVELARDVRLTWQADRMVLYRSVLGRGPAQYESVAEAPLG